MSLNGASILIVEDNPQDEELILRVLRKQGLAGEVKVARDGAEALKILFSPDQEKRNLMKDLKVIFLDLKLPKVNGLEVLQKIKENERTKFIPVVCLTSSPEENDIKESYHLGANSYIVKPVEFDEFTRTIGNVGAYWLLLNQTSPG